MFADVYHAQINLRERFLKSWTAIVISMCNFSFDFFPYLLARRNLVQWSKDYAEIRGNFSVALTMLI